MHKLIVFISTIILLFGCGTYCPPDVDNQQPRALGIVEGVLVKESIDATCDRVDWRHYSAHSDGRVVALFSFGELYKPHGVRGEIQLFDMPGNVLQRQPITPEQREYKFVFPVKKDENYFFRVEATKGTAGYMIDLKLEPLDPCAKCQGVVCCNNVCCAPGEVCINGICSKPGVCVPECSEGEVCEDGRCVPACPGGCPKGHYCSINLRRCVKAGGGAPPPPPAKECNPPCNPVDERCNPKTLQCEVLPYINCSVLEVQPGAGTSSIILINRGHKDGVKIGATGSVKSFGLKVIEVTATRCRATVSAIAKEIPKGTACKINK